MSNSYQLNVELLLFIVEFGVGPPHGLDDPGLLLQLSPETQVLVPMLGYSFRQTLRPIKNLLDSGNTFSPSLMLFG